jgi:phage gp37-like protein
MFALAIAAYLYVCSIPMSVYVVTCPGGWDAQVIAASIVVVPAIKVTT